MDAQNERRGQPSTDPNQPPPPSELLPAGPAPQNPATGFPPAMVYPPTVGYPPPYHEGYPPNPNATYINHQQQQYYAQPPPQMYYQDPRYQGRHGSKFAGCLLSMMIFMTLGLILLLAMRPRYPVVQVDSFQVSNFNVETDNFTATWDANLTIHNNYRAARFYFDNIQSFVFLNKDDLLASSFLESAGHPITMAEHDKEKFNVRVSTNDYYKPPQEKKAIEEMRDKRKTGSINFSMKFFAWSHVESGLLHSSKRYIQIRIYCAGLKVDFEGNSGNGKMNGGGSKTCDVDL